MQGAVSCFRHPMFQPFERIPSSVGSRAHVSATSPWRCGGPVRRSELQSKEVTMINSMALTTRSFLLRLALTATMILCFAMTTRAGGPKLVAGTSYFDPATAGQPLIWPQGLITYYTDQGDLSSYLPNASANALVATAFSQWTAVPTAAVTATRGGQFAEDVNGTNVIVNADGTITMPFDVQPTATATPVGIVYDYDGSVTDALMGSGAGASSQCFSNAVFGGNDSYAAVATYREALIVMNPQCPRQASHDNDVKYRLGRVIGPARGLGSAALNPNGSRRTPHRSAPDYAVL